MSGPQNPEAAWRALALHQEAMQLQALTIRLTVLHPKAAELAAPRIQEEITKERQTKWLNQKQARSTTSSASGAPTRKPKPRASAARTPSRQPSSK